MKQNIKVGIYGASGYTAGELLRILLGHPNVHVQRVISGSHAGKRLADLHPHLAAGSNDLTLGSADEQGWEDCDCVFFATPAGIAMREATAVLDAGAKIIDLSADFRIKDTQIWQSWYGMEHRAPDLLAEAVYGLPETQRDQIASARLIANPGCYATTTQLALLPLLADKNNRARLDGEEIVADAKSGTSGAGRRVEKHLLLSEAGENFSCYAAEGHRHQPEIEGHLKEVYGAQWQVPLKVRFVPHLLPISRGLFVDLYLPFGSEDPERIRDAYTTFYAQEPFVRILPAGKNPQIKSVRGSNYCELAIFTPPQSRYIQVCAALDNLVKGAAGQAVQNMNIAFGLEETTALAIFGLSP